MLDYDNFSTMSESAQRILIYIGRTVPLNSSVSEEELIDVIPDPNQDISQQDVLDALDILVHEGFVTKTNGRCSMDNSIYHFINVILPQKWRELGLMP